MLDSHGYIAGGAVGNVYGPGDPADPKNTSVLSQDIPPTVSPDPFSGFSGKWQVSQTGMLILNDGTPGGATYGDTFFITPNGSRFVYNKGPPAAVYSVGSDWDISKGDNVSGNSANFRYAQDGTTYMQNYVVQNFAPNGANAGSGGGGSGGGSGSGGSGGGGGNIPNPPPVVPTVNPAAALAGIVSGIPEVPTDGSTVSGVVTSQAGNATASGGFTLLVPAGIPPTAFIYSNNGGGPYDQGQISTSLFYQDDEFGRPVSWRSSFGGIDSKIKRDRAFNKRSRLQIDAISNGHTPSRALRITEPIPVGIQHKWQVQQPFRFKPMGLKDMDYANRADVLDAAGVIPPPGMNKLSLAPTEYCSFDDGGIQIVSIPAPKDPPVTQADAQFYGALPFAATYYTYVDFNWVQWGGDGTSVAQLIVKMGQLFNMLIQLEKVRYQNFNQPVPVMEIMRLRRFENVSETDRIMGPIVNTITARLKMPNALNRTQAYFLYLYLPRLTDPRSTTSQAIEHLRRLMPPYFRAPRPQQSGGGGGGPGMPPLDPSPPGGPPSTGGSLPPSMPGGDPDFDEKYYDEIDELLYNPTPTSTGRVSLDGEKDLGPIQEKKYYDDGTYYPPPSGSKRNPRNPPETLEEKLADKLGDQLASEIMNVQPEAGYEELMPPAMDGVTPMQKLESLYTCAAMDTPFPRDSIMRQFQGNMDDPDVVEMWNMRQSPERMERANNRIIYAMWQPIRQQYIRPTKSRWSRAQMSAAIAELLPEIDCPGALPFFAWTLESTRELIAKMERDSDFELSQSEDKVEAILSRALRLKQAGAPEYGDELRRELTSKHMPKARVTSMKYLYGNQPSQQVGNQFLQTDCFSRVTDSIRH